MCHCVQFREYIYIVLSLDDLLVARNVLKKLEETSDITDIEANTEPRSCGRPVRKVKPPKQYERFQEHQEEDSDDDNFECQQLVVKRKLLEIEEPYIFENTGIKGNCF